MDTLTIMVSGIEKQIYLPAKLAERLGYFRDEGLAVELRSEASGVHAQDQLLLGAVQGVIGFYDHTVDMQAKGKQVESVVQFARAPGEAVLVSAKWRGQLVSPADFKGHLLGVTGRGSSTDFLTRYLALAAGVRQQDLSTVGVGSGASFAAALREGKIHAGMTTEPTVSQLVRSGEASIIVDLRTPAGTEALLGGPYPGACLYMTSSWVNTHKPLVQRLTNALVRTLRFIASHSAEEIAELVPPEFHAGDKATYVAALRHGKAMFTTDGAMPPGGPATVLKVLNLSDKAVLDKTIDLSKTYTNEFVSVVP